MLYYLWYLADFASIHTYVAGKINLLAWASNRVEDLSLGEFLEVMNQTAGILYVFMLPVTVYGLVATRNHPLSITRRKIDIHTLPKIMSTFSPAIIPALQYGDPKTQLLNVDPPEHRSAMTPDEFAISHKLVIGQRLDHERARQPSMRSWEHLCSASPASVRMNAPWWPSSACRYFATIGLRHLNCGMR